MAVCVYVCRFFFFARSARKFLDLARRLGEGPARLLANEARRSKHPTRAGKKKERRSQMLEEQATTAANGLSSERCG